MSIFIFNEDYTGPRFRYGLLVRPVSRFNIPDGFIIGSQLPHEQYKRYGTIDYPFELSQEDVFHYDLVKIGEF